MRNFLIGILFFVCGSLLAQKAPTNNYHSYVILSSEKNLRFVGESKATAWNPDSSLVEDVFHKMPGGLDSIAKNGKGHNDKEARELEALTKYNFEVVGFKTKEGHRVLFFNALCAEDPGNDVSHSKVVTVVLDGGPCYFRIYYDLDEGKWKNLSVNGRA